MSIHGSARNWWWSVLRGLFVVVLVLAVFGAYLARWSVGAAPLISSSAIDLALVWLIGSCALVFGLLQIGLGFRLKSWQARWTRPLELLALQPVRASAWRTDRRLSARRSH